MNFCTAFRAAFFAAIVMLGVASGARAADKVSMIMSWTAEAEHGGWYQAKATGIFARYGLDVTIRAGGPMLNTGQLLAGARSISASAPTVATRSTSSRAACRP
jgi:NitT/TauT family transport system substrate-binding protein